MKYVVSLLALSSLFTASLFFRSIWPPLGVVIITLLQVIHIYRSRPAIVDAAGTQLFAHFALDMVGLCILGTAYVMGNVVLGIVFCLLVWLSILFIKEPDSKA